MDKNLKKNMKALFGLIVDEAERNEDFAEELSLIDEIRRLLIL